MIINIYIVKMYNINVDVNYDSNFKYRKCLRDVFTMDITNIDISLNNIPDLDDETRDEMLFDENKVCKGLDYIYNLTKTNDHFNDLYSSAASVMFSEDPNIGLAVLYSYDYFNFFHLCFRDFVNNEFSIDSNHFKYLKNKFL